MSSVSLFELFANSAKREVDAIHSLTLSDSPLLQVTNTIKNILLPTTDLHIRPLSPSELSYFLPSRTDGVNDEYLHLGLEASSVTELNEKLTLERITAAWAIMRYRHPLLASKIIGERENAKFSYVPPANSLEAYKNAARTCMFIQSDITGSEIVSAYLNGPRTLSSDCLAMVAVVRSKQNLKRFDIVMFCTHYIGDGMALHTAMNELLGLLVGPNAEHPENVLKQEIDESLETTLIPESLEARLPVHGSTTYFRSVVERIDYLLSSARPIGAHVLPRIKRQERRTRTEDIVFSREDTIKILARCKKEHVSVGYAVMGFLATMWAEKLAKSDRKKLELPM